MGIINYSWVFGVQGDIIVTRNPLVIWASPTATKYKFVTKWGSKGTGDGQLDCPERIAVDSSGNVYVCDSGNNRV